MGRGGGYRDLGCGGETGPSQAGLGENFLFLAFLSLLPSTLASPLLLPPLSLLSYKKATGSPQRQLHLFSSPPNILHFFFFFLFNAKIEIFLR